tara:strand:+ start:1775 stop:1987 length:213 start_codon:yes stop_codon:yes gene_type:complete
MNTTETHQERFQSYYIDYLLNHGTIASYASAHGLTYETAKQRLDVARKAYEAITEQTYSDTLAATGLAFF